MWKFDFGAKDFEQYVININMTQEQAILKCEQMTTFEIVLSIEYRFISMTKKHKNICEHLYIPKVPSKASGYVVSAFKPISTFVKDHDTTLRVDLKKQWTTDIVNSLTEQ